MDERSILRHYLAALAYRTQKALRGAPARFAAFEAGHGIRPPREIVKHMSDVMNHARFRFGGPDGRLGPLDSLEAEIARFHGILEELGALLESGASPEGTTLEQLLQGPFSDAMTHAGQLAMLRRMAGSPIPPESFMDASISRANLGPNQPEPAAPFANWPEGPKATAFKAVHPVIPSRDVARSVAFYVDRLGFTFLGQDDADAPRYAVVERGGAQIHIQWHDPAEWSAVERPSLRFYVTGLDALHAEYEPHGVFHERTKIRDTPWGTREFAFFDPDRNGLTFYRDRT